MAHFNDHCPELLYFLLLMHTDRYFRSLFYHRIGSVWKMLIGWYRPGDKYFMIPAELELGKSCIFYHPFSTVLNAKHIGNGFSCAHCTTSGWGKGGKPIICDNVQLGAPVTIIGGISIGNNVIVGAGSIVVKDVPDNCIVAGNPAKVIKQVIE